MANWSRALLNLGEGLGQVAQTVGQREHAAMMAARQENFMRLDAQYRQQADDRQFEQRKELLGMESEIAGQRLEQQQTFELGMAERRERHDLTMQGHDAALRREQMRHESSLYERRASREDLQGAERSYAAQFEAIDERLAEVNDQITKQRAKASMDAMPLDRAVLEPWQAEIRQLQEQKRLLARQRDIHLAQLSDPRYQKLTAAEARQLPGNDRAQPTGSPKAAPRSEPARLAALGGVPQMPPKPPRMIEREQRKTRAVAPVETKTLVERVPTIERQLAPLKQQGVDFRRSEYEQQERDRRRVLESQSRLQLELLLRTGNISRKDRAMIREILAQRSREETQRRREAFKAQRG